MILKLLHSIPFLRKRYFERWGPKWVERKVAPFLPMLVEGDNILDIGSGGGLVVKHLRKKSFDTTGLDIADLSYDNSVKPVVYDGTTMPFADDTFDVALILTVLHHTEHPEAILAEAKRVAKRIIIIEDIYSNKFQQYLTYWMDGLVNFGYSPCPRTNKDDEGWRKAFDRLGLEVETVVYKRVLFFFRQAVYSLKKKI